MALKVPGEQRCAAAEYPFSSRKGGIEIAEPDKIFLENTNFAYAMNPNPDKGNIRETFLLNQLENTGAEVFAPTDASKILNFRTSKDIHSMPTGISIAFVMFVGVGLFI